jgi:hypothetical protein
MRSFLRFAVLAAGAATVLGGWTWSRSYVARGVGQRAEQRPETATVAFSELAQLGDDALPALLDAAVNPDRQIAAPARRQIESLMVNWSASQSQRSGADCEKVIDGLLARERRLTPSGRRWARRLGEASLRYAAVLRPSAENGSTGDPLLEKTQRLFDALQGISQLSDLPLNYRPYVAEAATPPRANLRNLVSPPVTTAVAPLALPEPITPPSAEPPEAELSVAAESPTEPAALVAEGSRPKPFVPEQASAAPPMASGPPSLTWRRVHTSSNRDEADGTQQPDEPSPDDKKTQAQAAESASSPPAALTQLLQGDEADRLLLVEQLLTGRHKDAARLLLELAKDPSPRVRASAISALGSSSNRQLTEAAWRLAMHDEDPRVASLAGQLEKLLR